MSVSRVVISSRGFNNCGTSIVRSSRYHNVFSSSALPLCAGRSVITPSSRSFSTSGRIYDGKTDSPSLSDTSVLSSERDAGFGFLNTSVSSSKVPSSNDEPASQASSKTSDPPPTLKRDVEPTTSDETSEMSSAEPAQSPPIPWYLQNRPTRFQTELDTESNARSVIPDLPVNPPPLLETVLEYISVTAGLDDLALLDLRHLDPPPALGPKLIMIIGTARSEKHLHVSADRFCRWLRREHGLKANAAGLLGRNELKIKLRRKMKRMKMLANVGGQEPEGNIDDGIRTGWICCTLGKLEAHPEDTEMPGVDVENFVGFRDVKPGVNVVVQMFTEEKRMEIDLETLWGGVLRTHDRNHRNAEDKLKLWDAEEVPQDTQQEQDETPEEIPLASPARSAPKLPTSRPSDPFPSEEQLPTRTWKRTPSDPFPSASGSSTTRQVRQLHTIGLGHTFTR